jgi:hypothetical protein
MAFIASHGIRNSYERDSMMSISNAARIFCSIPNFVSGLGLLVLFSSSVSSYLVARPSIDSTRQNRFISSKNIPDQASFPPFANVLSSWCTLSTKSSSSLSTTTTTISFDAVDEGQDDDGVVTASTRPAIDPQIVVKIFGRLAEKYIALDSSGGLCCYSGCTNCEFRLPGGGYIMAEQSSSRPKWIPTYVTRNTNSREHQSKWSQQLFPDSDCNTKVDSTTIKSKATSPTITKDKFVSTIIAMDYSPPLGGPYVGASAASLDESIIDDKSALECLFNLLSKNQDKVSKTRISVRLKQLSNGEEGLTWPAFSKAMGIA